MYILCKKTVLALVLAALLLSTAPQMMAATSSAVQLQQAQDEKIQLQQQLAQIEAQIAQYQQQLTQIQGQKNTLQNKIKQLKSQQSALTLQIKVTTLRIANIESQLVETQKAINKTIVKSNNLREQIGHIVRYIHQRQNQPLYYSLVVKGNISEALAEIKSYALMTARLHTLVDEARQTKLLLDKHADKLSAQQDEAQNLLSLKTIQQQQLLGSVDQQNTLLEQTKGKESNYQKALSDTKKRATEIKARLYQLLGVTQQINFGTAVQLAQFASQQTGVRASFLLAILTQESNLGKNVGTCNRAGDPPAKSWRVIMKPERDQKPFVQITNELGRDTDTTPVSCPMKDSKGNQLGWGGAMGPAQFIPSTWMGYRDKVKAITGKSADPWDIRDAFLAAAIKLKAGGAGTVSGEWAAAMRYFSGGTNPAYSFYGDNVVKIANQYQTDIDALTK